MMAAPCPSALVLELELDEEAYGDPAENLRDGEESTSFGSQRSNENHTK
jgi:hypothetical protein